ncbi:MAG TPA: helix-turn-helix transcriptional regulator [Verrucomicrobiae bacterium]|nr:helix-turn-helix transcriptional regulator [Verrucomicrobiae bacterium]
MNLEQKKALGYLIRRYRERKNWTQEYLESRSGVNLRTIQRAERGDGINSHNLAGIAESFNMDAGELIIAAEKAGSPPPEMRISLKEIRSAQSLITILKRRTKYGGSLELSPPDEHPYNEMIGMDIVELDSDLESPKESEQGRISRLRCAQFILSMCRQMGFCLFAGYYIEKLQTKGHVRRKKTTLIIAAPQADPRIVKTRSAKELDVIRDSRHLLLGGMISGHTTTYSWLEHELISDGEETVKDAFRRIMAEVMREVNQTEVEARNKKTVRNGAPD